MNLDRLTLILETVSQKGQASVADISESAGLPKPSAYRLVQDLVEAGLLDPVSKGIFAIGGRLKRIARSDLSDETLLEVVTPVLKQAADHFGAAFFLARLRAQAVEIVHVETPNTGVSYLHPGLGERPLHACSCAKAIAAFTSFNIQTPLKAYTEFTLTSADNVEAEFDKIRQRGYAECVEELERGMCSVAAALGASGIAADLAIGASGSQRVFNEAFREQLGRELLKLAEQLNQKFGWVQDTRAA